MWLSFEAIANSVRKIGFLSEEFYLGNIKASSGVAGYVVGGADDLVVDNELSSAVFFVADSQSISL